MSTTNYLLGFDIGSSSVKATLINAATGLSVATASSPKNEMQISTPHEGWAEQDPELWWTNAVFATKLVLQQSKVSNKDVVAIGIAYQMHGLVVVDHDQKVLRPSIIWCDSRAVAVGEKAYSALGKDYCIGHLLNSPGNFTASKLRWVRENEPEIYERIDKFMLPGDFLAMRLTGEVSTTTSGLSEGIFWDYQAETISSEVLAHFDIEKSLIPDLVPTYGYQGKLTINAAEELGLNPGTMVCYRSGDQPNNAFSLNTLDPGEVASTAGTSGVIYAVTDQLLTDALSRVNTFIHVNHSKQSPRYGVLLCINGTGSMNSWLRRSWSFASNVTYTQLNQLAENISIGSDGLRILPFGNGVERMFENQQLGASFHCLDLNRHHAGHVSRAAQEGIVFSLAFGLSLIRELGIQPNVIRAGRANMFLSDVFCEAFANTINVSLALYNTDGSHAAARGAGVGKGIYSNAKEAMVGLQCIKEVEPQATIQEQYGDAYQHWKSLLIKELK